MSGEVLLSIIVKALDEEEKIAASLTAALAEATAVGGEVILVDSLSRDRTVEIASRYPVRIVQFERPEDVCCGAAVQLGYQHARGSYIYLVDADMVIEPGFVREALAYLNVNPAVAGVGGVIVDTQLLSTADHRRRDYYAAIRAPMIVPTLGGGGLYRRSAIDQVGYLGHRALKACEEAELGVRLRAAGWRLVRLPSIAVTHTGHRETEWDRFRRLWRSGRMRANGVFLRSAFGKPWWWRAVRTTWFTFMPVVLFLLVLGSWLALTLNGMQSGVALGMAFSGVALATLAVLSLRRRSVRRGISSIVGWHLSFLAVILSFGTGLRDTRSAIPSRELSTPVVQ